MASRRERYMKACAAGVQAGVTVTRMPMIGHEEEVEHPIGDAIHNAGARAVNALKRAVSPADKVRELPMRRKRPSIDYGKAAGPENEPSEVESFVGRSIWRGLTKHSKPVEGPDVGAPHQRAIQEARGARQRAANPVYKPTPLKSPVSARPKKLAVGDPAENVLPTAGLVKPRRRRKKRFTQATEPESTLHAVDRLNKTYNPVVAVPIGVARYLKRSVYTPSMSMSHLTRRDRYELSLLGVELALPGEPVTPTPFETNHPWLNAAKPWGSKRRKVAVLRKHLYGGNVTTGPGIMPEKGEVPLVYGAKLLTDLLPSNRKKHKKPAAMGPGLKPPKPQPGWIKAKRGVAPSPKPGLVARPKATADHVKVHATQSAYHAQQASHFATQAKAQPGQGHEEMAQAHATMAARHKEISTGQKPADPTSSASHREQSEKHASEAARHHVLARQEPEKAEEHLAHAKAYDTLSTAHARIAHERGE